jgi:hypothetical protein
MKCEGGTCSPSSTNNPEKRIEETIRQGILEEVGRYWAFQTFFYGVIGNRLKQQYKKTDLDNIQTLYIIILRMRG